MQCALDAFDKKVFFCGEYSFVKEYSIPFITGIKKSENCIKNYDDRQNGKRFDNLQRCRDTVARYVYTNLTPHTKFLTLTTSDTCLDVKEFSRKLTTFFQSMKRNGYDLDYLYVFERQKERGVKENNIGSLHAHLIVFNDEKIELSVLNKCWHYGSTDIKILDGLRCKSSKKTAELIKNPASYVCKYITKESVAEWNEKVFRTSKGLKKPVEINGTGYLTTDSYTRSENCEALMEHIHNDYILLYEKTKTARFETKQGKFERFIDTSIYKREVV